MAADYDELRVEIASKLPGALEGAIDLELGAVLREFSMITSAITEQELFSTVADTLTYTITPVGNVRQLLNIEDSDGEIVRGQYAFKQPNTIEFFSQPTVGEVYTANVAVTPSTTEADIELRVPTWVWQKYRDVLLDGVLGRMMTQPAKPYRQEQVGIYHLRRYRDGMAQTRAEALRRYTFRGQGWKFPTFA